MRQDLQDDLDKAYDIFSRAEWTDPSCLTKGISRPQPASATGDTLIQGPCPPKASSKRRKSEPSSILPPTGRSTCLTFSPNRSEEHTSELQSHLNLVCRLLLEKKKPHHSILHINAPHTSQLRANASSLSV